MIGRDLPQLVRRQPAHPVDAQGHGPFADLAELAVLGVVLAEGADDRQSHHAGQLLQGVGRGRIGRHDVPVWQWSRLPAGKVFRALGFNT